MTFEWAIMHFGYLAVMIGAFFEGEVILILAGFAAHRGYLNLPLVIMFAFLGTLMGDQFYFFLGRSKGQAVLAKHPGWSKRIARFRSLIDKYNILILLSYRFLYGLRTVSPFAIGMSDISTKKFIVFNVISVAVWSVVVISLGYVFGHAMEILMKDIKRYEIAFMCGLLVIALIVFFIKRYRNRTINR
jgi:membrane protein DedA with SNARE-associated domain